MRRIVVGLAVMMVAAVALAHAGHIHNFLGTVKSIADTRLVITTPDAKAVTFVLNATTSFTRDGKPAPRAEVVVGQRVAVHVADDGKTATWVKLGTK